MSDNKTKVTVCVTAEYDKAKKEFISGDEDVKITVGDTKNIENAEKAAEVIGKLSAPADATAADGIGNANTVVGNTDDKDGANNGDGKNATNPDVGNTGAQDKSGAGDGNDKDGANPIPPAGDATNSGAAPGANNSDIKAKEEAVEAARQKLNNSLQQKPPDFDAVAKAETELKTANEVLDAAKKVKKGGRSKAKRRRAKRGGTKKKKHTKRQRRYGSKTKKC